MTPEPRFLNLCPEFWAHVRAISERLGYRSRDDESEDAGPPSSDEADVDTDDVAIRVQRPELIRTLFDKLGLKTDHLWDKQQRPTTFGSSLLDYLAYRERVLREHVRPKLMVIPGAIPNKLKVKELAKLQQQLSTLTDKGAIARKRISIARKTEYIRRVEEQEARCRSIVEVMHEEIPKGIGDQAFSKNQKIGDPSPGSIFNRLVTALIIKDAKTNDFERKPKQLTTFRYRNRPFRTLARWVDGAFSRVIDPVAVWEVKEYYTGISFGSRIADGIYETMLDGMELAELRAQKQFKNAGLELKHYYIADGYYNFWIKGRSYLCRAIDMLHMGLVTEVLFGYEVVERLPELVPQWIELDRRRGSAGKMGHK